MAHNKAIKPALDFKQAATAMLCGVFVGSIMIVLSLSYTSLIFSGTASVHLDTALVISLSSVMIVGLMSALLSGSRFLVIQLDDDTAPVFALIIAAVLASVPASTSPEEVLPLLLMHIFCACFFTSALLALCGQFKLGNLVQFLPYSVMGGYFAAVGWLMVTGSIIMLAQAEQLSIDLFSFETLVRWLPALLAGGCIRYFANKYNTGLVLSVSLCIFIGAFYLTAFVNGLGIAELEQQNWLIGPFENMKSSVINPVWQLDWSSFSWLMLKNSAGTMASLALIAMLSFILTISAIALTTERDLDLNRELKVAGFSNMVASILGGLLALPSVSLSKLSYDLNRTATRLTGLAMVLLVLTVFYFAMDLIARLPRMVLGALSIYIGLGFAVDWLIKGVKRFGLLEYSVIPIILVVSITVGFLPSILVGVVSAVILFAIKYSQVKVVRYESTAQSFRSSLMRDSSQNELLMRLGNQVRFFQLQGYLFFGTAGSLYKQVMQAVEVAHADKQQANQLRFIILDFSHVSGVDASAMLNLEKLAQRLNERKIGLVTAGIKPDVQQILQRSRLNSQSASSTLHHYHDMDAALQWCEDEILDTANQGIKVGRGLFERIADELKNDNDVTALAQYVQLHTAEKGELIARMGDLSDHVFFLETCTASAYIVDADGLEHRVSGAGRGAIFGEIGFLLGVPRTANVRTDSAGTYYALSADQLQKMEREDPELAVIITHYLAKVVTERLANTTNALRSLM